MPPAPSPTLGHSPNGDRMRDPETRNLLLGLAVGALFVVIFVAALFLAGPQAPIIAAGSSIVSMLVLWFLSRMDVHRQPNGIFLSMTVAGFVAMFVPLAVGLVVFLNNQQLEQRLTAAQAQPTPVPAPAPLPSLLKSFVIEAPDPATDDYVRVIRDSPVEIEGKEYSIAVGDEFPLYRVADDEVIVKGRDFLISLPPDVLRVVRAQKTGATAAPSPEATPNADGGGKLSPMERAELTRKAQAEATKRYPALGIKDTAENRIFLSSYNGLKEANSDLLKDPEWPLQLAEALAEREGWRRADIAPPPPPRRAEPVQPGITAESPDDAPGFPPFDPTPPSADEFGEQMPLPQ